ncbi:MAG: type II toxin-antitoxin system HicA family toxin [Saprospiraceae bacterium]|nr:type II toxin-antitoxin system HicA family toxin [Saprospiraceae bacterium]
MNRYLCVKGKASKLLEKILYGKSDHNIKFNELCNLLTKLGFEVRIKGSHYIYYKESIQEIINIQEIVGHSKAYQVKQIREIIFNYKLEIQEDDES